MTPARGRDCDCPLPRDRRLGFAFAALIFLIDQGVKALMIGPLALREHGLIELLAIFDLRWTENYGISLGLFTARSDTGRWLLVALTAAIAAGVGVWITREKHRGEIPALALILGGALGNIVDRVRFGYVVDYADLHFGDFRPFLIFNIADAAITFGVVLLLARSLLLRDKPGKPRPPKSRQAPTETP